LAALVAAIIFSGLLWTTAMAEACELLRGTHGAPAAHFFAAQKAAGGLPDQPGTIGVDPTRPVANLTLTGVWARNHLPLSKSLFDDDPKYQFVRTFMRCLRTAVKHMESGPPGEWAWSSAHL
jgi:hypothetical protein